MPIYEYQCPKCFAVKTDLASIRETKLPYCLNCHLDMPKILSATAGYVKDTSNPCKIK